jgi:hypothetical protein
MFLEKKKKEEKIYLRAWARKISLRVIRDRLAGELYRETKDKPDLPK